jgi:hypothetical protein
MHYTIVSGSKEYMLVNVGDRLEDVTDLGPLNPTFTVYGPDDTPKQTNVPAQVDTDNKLVAKCLIDTATGGNWASDIYRLYLTLQASPETPKLGPVPIKVEAV